MKTVIITLRVTYDENAGYTDPVNWDWFNMMDIGPGEDVEVLECV